MTIKEAVHKLWKELHIREWCQGIGINSPIDDTIVLYITKKNHDNKNWFLCVNYEGYKFQVKEIGRIKLL